MDAGVAVATQFNLMPGIALTDAQMAALTSNIVWLVSQTVTLADGTQQTVLAPQIYLANSNSLALTPTGALIAGDTLSIQARDVSNTAATLSGTTTASVVADNISIAGGAITGGNVAVIAKNDLNISALTNTTTFTNAGSSGNGTTSITVAGAAGKIIATNNLIVGAGNNINLNGANLSAGNNAAVSAGNQLNVGTVATGMSSNLQSATAQSSKHSETQTGSAISAGGNLSLSSAGDTNIIGSAVGAGNTLSIISAGNVNVTSAVSKQDFSFSSNNDNSHNDSAASSSNAAGSSLTSGGNAAIYAGAQQTSSGAWIMGNAGIPAKSIMFEGSTLKSTGDVQLAATGNISLQEATSRASLKADGSNSSSGSFFSGSSSSNNTDLFVATGAQGSAISGNQVSVAALGDVNVRGSSITADDALLVAARGDINVTESRGMQHTATSSDNQSSGLLSSSGAKRSDDVLQQYGNASTLSGDSVTLAGNNILVQGSSIVGTKDVLLSATNNLTLTTSQSTVDQTHTSEESKSGLMGTGFGITLGSRDQATNSTSSTTTNAGSSVGSVGGDVTLLAGNQYMQTGSQVLVPSGDISIAAKSVDIKSAYDTYTSTQKQSFDQSGLTLAVTSPVISAVQSASQLADASSKTSDPRMKALAAASVGMNAYQIDKDIATKSPQDAAGIKLTLSIGSSSNDSTITQTGVNAVGSTVGAGGNVNIVATGGGTASNINIVGSNITAGGNANLIADNQVNLLAAQNTFTQTGENNSSSASVGIGFGFGGSQNGWTLELGVAGGRGDQNGTDLSNTSTIVRAGNSANLISGGDTNLKGAVLAGNTVNAIIGGNLNIESLQDTSTYQSKDNSSGFGVSLCIPPFCAGSSSFSASVASAKVNGNYASVTTQSGIKAGDGGFAVVVNGNTDLKGGVIQSSQQAIADGNNTLITGTLTQSDIKNHDDFSADGFSVGASYATAPANKDRSAMLDENGNAKPAVPGGSAGIGSDSGNKNSTTVSGISGGTLVITNDAAQLALTGTTAEQTIASVNRDVDSSKDSSGALIKAWNGDALRQDVQAQATITAAFGKDASKLVGDYADNRRNALNTQATAAANKGDDASAKALFAEAANWDEGGASRVAAHIAVGLLGGGLQGAMGAGASAALASSMNSFLNDSTLPDSLKSAVGAALAGAVGAAVGGVSGAAAGLNQDVNNRQIHEDGIAKEKTLAKKLADESNGQYTQAQIEDALRAANNKILGETASNGAVVAYDSKSALRIYDGSGMVLGRVADGTYVLMQDPATLNSPSPDLQNFIKAGTGDTYSWNAAGTQLSAVPVSALPAILTGTVTPEMLAARRNNAADVAGWVSTQSGRVSAASAAYAAYLATQPNVAAQTGAALQFGIAGAATLVGFGAGGLEQLLRPNIGQMTINSLTDIAAKPLMDRFLIYGPVINEALENWKNSDSANKLQDKLNESVKGH